ncbi:MAG: MFS transporter [Desulfovibrio desulfuricans]|jgi:YNFM family putative membrane transporter|nr:MFS transporter [Desulfovibrio desulfuricans]
MPHPHTSVVFKTYACLLLLTACSYALMYGPQPMFNIISAELDVDRGHIGLLVSVFMLSLSIAPLCVGLLLGRLGVRRSVVLAAALLGCSGAGVWLAGTYERLLCVRVLQAVLTPVLLTGIMACIAAMFRHLDMNRALAGYVTATLLGALAGRLGGGCGAEIFGWRATLVAICGLFFFCLVFARDIPAQAGGKPGVHRLRDYGVVLRQPGVPALLFVEACGIFTFAAIGNLIPLRMAELGQGGSEGFIGLMYLGYSIGMAASLALNPLKRLFGTTARLLVFGAALFTASLLTLLPPLVWTLFGGLWFIALGEFIVHSLAPGLINHLATKSGQCDRGMVNGLFLSCYYFGGLLGSWLPGLLYARCGWPACLACMFGAQLASLAVITALCRRRPEIG